MKSLNPRVLEAIYFKGILSSVTYGISVWGNCSPNIFQDLEDTHARAARFIHKIPETVPDHWVLDNENWENIFYLYKRRVACITFQACHELSWANQQIDTESYPTKITKGQYEAICQQTKN